MDPNQEIIEQENMMDGEDTLRDRYLTFRLAGQEYAFEIKYVTEIIGIQKITEVPNILSYIVGIINLRGIIYPIVSVRKRFGLDVVDYTDRTCIIIVRVNNDGVGLIVDEVSEVMNIKENQISPPPQTNKGSQSRFISGIGKIGEHVKIILDINKLLYDEKRDKESE